MIFPKIDRLLLNTCKTCADKVPQQPPKPPPPTTPPPPSPPARRFAQARVALCREETVFSVRTQAGGLVADGCTRCGQRHSQCPPPEGTTPALVVATRAAERRSCPRLSPTPQRWSWSGVVARGAAGGGGARRVRRPTGTEHSTSGDAAGSPAGSRAAVGRGSHGRLRGCRAPSLVVAPVAAHDELDTASVQYLLQQSLLARVEEEEEAKEQEEDKRQEEAVVTRMQRLETEVTKYAGRDRSQLSDLEKAAVVLVAHSDALRRRRERRRKMKKRKKKKLPRGRVSRGRARRRQRQWHVSGSPGDVRLYAVFPSIVDRPEMPCIVAGVDQKDRCSGMNNAGIAGDSEHRAVFLPFVRPMMLRIMAGMLGRMVARGIQANWISWEITLVPCFWQSIVRYWCA